MPSSLQSVFLKSTSQSPFLVACVFLTPRNPGRRQRRRVLQVLTLLRAGIHGGGRLMREERSIVALHSPLAVSFLRDPRGGSLAPLITFKYCYETYLRSTVTVYSGLKIEVWEQSGHSSPIALTMDVSIAHADGGSRILKMGVQGHVHRRQSHLL